MAVVKLKDGRTRTFRSKEERRHIVEETMKPGASVALDACAHDVNANQVFKWRRQYRQGRLDVAKPAAALVPDRTSDALPIAASSPRRKSRTKLRTLLTHPSLPVNTTLT